MKKIFTLMLTLAVALFAGVSCTTDQGTQSGKTVKVTVSGAPEANLPATAGEFTLNYAITNATLTGVLEVTTDAAWVHVGEIGADAVPFTYDANTDAPGTAPREAVISFAYTDADVVTVTVRQDSAEPSFAVTFDEATTTHQVSYYTCDAVDDTMSYVLATDSDIKGMNITGETPTELLTNYVKQLATYGMLTDEYLPYGYWFKGDITEPREAMRYTADPVTLYAVGFSATPTGEVDEWDAPIYNVTLTTAVHAWEVPFKGYPSIVVENLEHTVTCEAGTLELSATLENPLANTEEATYSTKVETEATWVVPTWADGKLTLAYEANTTALPRSAEIELNYGQDMGYYFMGAAETVRLQLTQEADANATKVTFDIQVVETHFDRIVVNVTPSDLEADYVLNTKSVMKDENNQVVEENWTNVVVNNMKYPSNLSFFKGKLENHVIKMNPTYYEWNGYDYYVYAFATDAAHTAPLCEPSYVTTTVDASDYPTLTWDVEKSGLVWNENADRYDIEVTEGSTLVLYYNVEHPVEGAAVKLNGTSLYDSYNVVDGEPVIDNAAGTVTLKIDKFDTAKKYHYVSVTLKYTNAEEDMWGVTTPNLRITQVKANVKIESIDNLVAGEYYAGGYLASYDYNGSTIDWTANPYHLINGISTDLYTTPYAHTDGLLVKKEGEQYDAAIVTLEAVEGKANTYYVKVGADYLTSTAASNRKLGSTSTPSEWVASNNANGGISLMHVDTGVYLGTAGATSKLCRSYTSESTLKYGLVFFTLAE